jgi:hypothetical protein
MIFRQFNNNDTNSRLIAFLIIALLAAVSTILMFTADTVKFYPYRLKSIGNEEAPSKWRIYYDVNSNGKQELFYFKTYSGAGESVIEYHNDKGGFVDVIRPSGFF